MLEFRSALVPVQAVSAKIMNFVVLAMIFGGAFIHNFWPTALLIMIACYGAFSLFALVTLPVEFDASKRALAWVQSRGIVNTSEYDMAKDALKWAAMTYVVAAIAALTTLFYYVMLFLGSRED
jgi:Zn-dependent membrane protease YugP